MRQIVGHLDYNVELTIDKRGFTADTDGSVEKERDDGGVIMVDSDVKMVTSQFLVDGREYIDYFLSEAKAVISGILLLDFSKPENGARGKIWSDSRSCLDRLTAKPSTSA